VQRLKILLPINTIAVASLLFSSCGLMEQAMRSTPGADEQLVQEEPVFIEDFYEADIAEAGKTVSIVEPIQRKDAFITPPAEQIAAREMVYDLDEIAGISDIGGGEEISYEDEEASEVALSTAMVGEQFNPSKLEGKVMVDVLMDDVSCYTFPLDQLRINSNFGWRRGRVHSGIDLDLEIGDHVYAAFDGTVKRAEYTKGYGNLIVLEHPNGLQTYYAHLSKIKVEPGQEITSGDLIGLGGSTGRSTGPHLHFEVRYLGAYMDPSNLIDFKTGELKSTILTVQKSSFNLQNDVSTAKYHTVRSGDTLSKIARQYGTSVSRICKLNGISSTKVIRPGQRLRVR